MTRPLTTCAKMPVVPPHMLQQVGIQTSCVACAATSDPLSHCRPVAPSPAVAPSAAESFRKSRRSRRTLLAMPILLLLLFAVPLDLAPHDSGAPDSMHVLPRPARRGHR